MLAADRLEMETAARIIHCQSAMPTARLLHYTYFCFRKNCCISPIFITTIVFRKRSDLMKQNIAKTYLCRICYLCTCKIAFSFGSTMPYCHLWGCRFCDPWRLCLCRWGRHSRTSAGKFSAGRTSCIASKLSTLC